MSKRRLSIGQVMVVIALAAVNLAVIRSVPPEISSYPSLWVFLASLDFVVVWKLILSRPFRAFHYTFLIVFLLGFFVLAYFAATDRFRPLGVSIRIYQQLSSSEAKVVTAAPLPKSEVWTACVLSFVLACALGLAAGWLETRRGWDIAAFFRGALIGFGIANLLVLLESAATGEWGALSRARIIGRLVLLGVCVIGGGLMGLFKLASTPPTESAARTIGRSA